MGRDQRQASVTGAAAAGPLLLLVLGCTSLPPPRAPVPPAPVPPAPVPEIPAALRACQQESISPRDDPQLSEALSCGELRVVHVVRHGAGRSAEEWVDLLRDLRRNQGAEVEVLTGSIEGKPTPGVHAMVGEAARPLHDELRTFLREAPEDPLTVLTCHTAGSPLAAHKCWDLFAALRSTSWRSRPRTEAGAPWTMSLAGRRIKLTPDCYWKDALNIFCRRGQLSWTLLSSPSRAQAYSDFERNRVGSGSAGLKRTTEGPDSCQIAGLPAYCARERLEFSAPFKAQVVEAIYGAIDLDERGMSVTCSVDRATVPEGLGPLCGQLVELGPGTASTP